MTVQEIWALLNFYKSVFSGEQIDEAIGVILNGGIDAAVDAAEASAAAAAKSAQEAAGSATDLGAAVKNAQSAAGLADSSAKTAESYAKGGTGTREGEDTDNARYYATLAASAAGGGVVAVDGEVPDETGNVPLQRANARLSLLEYMAQNNDYVAPITTDDNNPSAILVDDDGNAILANWKYKEV